MVDLVGDSSVAVKWFVPEAHTAEAVRILRGYESGAISFLAPDLSYAELRFALSGVEFARRVPVRDGR